MPRLCSNEYFHDYCPRYDCFQICFVYAYNMEHASSVDLKNILGNISINTLSLLANVVTYMYHISYNL